MIARQADLVRPDRAGRRPVPTVRLRAIVDLQIEVPGAGGPEMKTVLASNIFTFDPVALGEWSNAAQRLLREGRAEVVDKRPGWLPKVTVRMRALGQCTTPVGEHGLGDVFDLPFESRVERELVLWNIHGGVWELVGNPPPSWPAGHIRSTAGGGR